MQAQTWLEQNSPLTNKDQDTWRHYWAMAFSESSENWETVEIPLEYLEMPVIILPENMEMCEQTGDHSYLVNSKRTVVATNKETGEMAGFFMNVVPSLQYLQENSFDPLNNSYLDRDEDFDGMVLFYSLQGDFINGWTYSQGEITGAVLYETDDPDTQQEKNNSGEELWMICSHITVYHFTDWVNAYTGEDWGTTFHGTSYDEVCILVWLTPTGYSGPIDNIDDGPDMGGGVGLGIFARAQPRYAGYVEGSDTYVPNSTVTLSATPNPGYAFGHWQEVSPSYFNPPPLPFNPYEATVSFFAERPMIVRAVFSQLYPCKEDEDNVFAPLYGSFNIQGSGEGGWNWNGGTFGDVRNQGATPHFGLDFAAPVGEPIFAMSDGCVLGDGYYEAGNKNRNYGLTGRGYSLDPNHQGTDDDAGNRITLYNEQGGYAVSYFHLHEDDPIGWNPEENRPWLPGDCVQAGAIIGYVGLTGSATHPTSGGSHLHLGVRPASGTWDNISLSGWINPKTHFSNMFINLGSQSQDVSTPCDD